MPTSAGHQPRLRPRHHSAGWSQRADAVYAHSFSDSCVNMVEGVPVLARRRHGGRLLGRQHRADQGRPGSQPLRPRLADLDLPGAAAARQVRVRRGEPPRLGDRLPGLRRRRHQRGDGPALGAVLQRARARACVHRGLGGAARRGHSCPRQAEARDRRSLLRAPTGPRGRARPGSRPQALSRDPERHHA